MTRSQLADFLGLIMVNNSTAKVKQKFPQLVKTIHYPEEIGGRSFDRFLRHYELVRLPKECLLEMARRMDNPFRK